MQKFKRKITITEKFLLVYENLEIKKQPLIAQILNDLETQNIYWE